MPQRRCGLKKRNRDLSKALHKCHQGRQQLLKVFPNGPITLKLDALLALLDLALNDMQALAHYNAA